MLCCEMCCSESVDVEGRCLPPWMRRREDSGTEVRRESRVVRLAIEVVVGSVSGIAMMCMLVVVW